VIIEEEPYLQHYGILRRSGRYPWGSSSSQNVRNRTFLEFVKQLLGMGMSEVQVAESIGISTTQLRAAKSIATNQQRQQKINLAQKYKDKGMSNVAIGEKMGINESVVRSYLAPGASLKSDILTSTANMLKAEVDAKGYVDVGVGVENLIGVNKTALKTAVAIAQEEGYPLYSNFTVKQLGTGQETRLKFLAQPGTTWDEARLNKENIQQIGKKSKDRGSNFYGMEDPLSVNPKRVGVVYGSEGGVDADGVIYVRRGVSDISMGDNSYAQVRIKVGDSHYLKGMAIYKDDMPDGVDLLFNTNKESTGNKLDAMKPLLKDVDNPFGAIVDQIGTPNGDGTTTLTSAMNLVNKEGDWNEWSRSIATQVLSKQSPKLAKEQLAVTYENRLKEYESIMALTNPTVKRKLLAEFAEGADSAAVHLKAAALPRQRTQVILPLNSLKDNQIYAPNFKQGEAVVLIRYPHGGKFEIPELVVNNRNPEGSSIIGSAAKDAVGINSKVAERLSGADFDGDTVLVIPNDSRKIKTSPALEGLKDFNPRVSYPEYEGMKPVSPREMQIQMGKVTNLITDMTIRKASAAELARAVKHSMVVIDSEKHSLDYKSSAIDNGISALKDKYQRDGDGPAGGATTIISRASSPIRVNERRAARVGEGGPIDPKTGKKVFVETANSYVNKKGQTVYKKTELKKLEATDDASTLSSGTPIERVYVDHSNKLKSLGNQSRKDMLATPLATYNRDAAKVYSKEVESLNAKLNTALKNAPRERQAQVVANGIVQMKVDATPNMDQTQRKRIETQALNEARARTGAGKQKIEFTDNEWTAIQAGAISDTKLSTMLNNANMDKVRELATPKAPLLMTSAKTTRASSMLASGYYTRAEVAAALGVSLSTLDASSP